MPNASRPVQRQMVELDVFETSGVDHPAHGYEGWLVKKSAGAGRVARLNSILKGTAMPTITKEALLKSVADSKLPDAEKAFVTKALDLQEDVDAAAALWQSLRAKLEAGDPETPTTTDLAPAAPVIAAEAPAPVAPAVPDIFKSVTDPAARDALQKASADNPELAKALGALADQAASAMEKAAREENTRLDSEAVAKSRTELPHLGIDHVKVAPALRKMAAIDPAGAAAIAETLAKADAQLDSANIFMELGTGQPAKGNTAMAKATAIAEGYIAAGVETNMAKAVAKAFADNPSLYSEHESEAV